MRNIRRYLTLVFTCLSFFVPTVVLADFNNTKKISTKDLNLQIKGTFSNNGILIGENSLVIFCDRLEGAGYINAPKIVLFLEECAFEGEIFCSKKCVIITSKPIEEIPFRWRGGGELIFLLESEVDLNDIL